MREGVRVQIIILGFLHSAVNCGPLTDPDNGQVDTSNGTTFGSTATYTCHKESVSRTCGADGLWTSTKPNCQGKNRNNYHAEAVKLGVQLTDLLFPSDDCTGFITLITISSIAAIWLVISMAIIVLLSGYIVHLKRHHK